MRCSNSRRASSRFNSARRSRTHPHFGRLHARFRIRARRRSTVAQSRRVRTAILSPRQGSKTGSAIRRRSRTLRRAPKPCRRRNQHPANRPEQPGRNAARLHNKGNSPSGQTRFPAPNLRGHPRCARPQNARSRDLRCNNIRRRLRNTRRLMPNGRRSGRNRNRNNGPRDARSTPRDKRPQ